MFAKEFTDKSSISLNDTPQPITENLGINPNGNQIWSELIEMDIPLDKVVPHLEAIIKLPEQAPTWLEAFLGYYFDTRRRLLEALTLTIKEIEEQESLLIAQLDPTSKSIVSEKLEKLNKLQDRIKKSLSIYSISTQKLWFYQWSVVVLLAFTTIFLLAIIEVYVRWHGTTILGNLTNFYNDQQVMTLSQINFKNGATTMSVALEILVWSLVGAWAQQAYYNARLMTQRAFRFADHGPMYLGIIMRNTGVAAAVILLLRLTQFSIFGVSLDGSSPLAFDATIGLSFLLGFFGDDAISVLSRFRDAIVKQEVESEK